MSYLSHLKSHSAVCTTQLALIQRTFPSIILLTDRLPEQIITAQVNTVAKLPITVQILSHCQQGPEDLALVKGAKTKVASIRVQKPRVNLIAPLPRAVVWLQLG